MPFVSCAAVQLMVGLPATAGGAVSTGATSGGVLSTVTGTPAVVVTLPALSVITIWTKSAPSPTAAAVVSHARV